MTIGGQSLRIGEASCLDATAIVAVAKNELTAVRIPNWCEEVVCTHFMKQISGIVGTGYDVEPHLMKVIGGAAFDAADCPTKLRNYLDSASIWTEEYRRVFAPYLSPIDRLRLELQERWSYGCELQRFGGRNGFAGLVRAFEGGAEARVHQDMTHWDIPDVPEAHEFETQLSAVIYLGCARGGELELWDKSISDRVEYDRYKIPNDYGIDRKYIGRPVARLTPRVGEMIIFNARNLHAVSRVDWGKRVSQSTFVAFRGINKPLSLFS